MSDPVRPSRDRREWYTSLAIVATVLSSLFGLGGSDVLALRVMLMGVVFAVLAVAHRP